VDRSGWCLKLPVTEFNQAEHDGCYKHFATRSCACECGHKGERTLESRDVTRYTVATPKKLKTIEGTEDDTE
jgi:hypothetical protein